MRSAQQPKVRKTSPQEAMAKTEVARHKAAEEAITVTQERDEALSRAEEARREVDRLKKRMEQLRAQVEAASGGEGASSDADKQRQQLDEAKKQQTRLEAQVEELQAALQSAQEAVGSGAEKQESSDLDDRVQEIGVQAIDVYNDINDVLSQMRNDLMLVQGEFEEITGDPSDDSLRTIRSTVEGLVGQAEDAKGVIRRLRELAT